MPSNSPTVIEALAAAKSALGGADIENPRLEAQLLLAWAVGGRREDLAREPERVLTERERIIFDKAVSLRCARRPLAYITGERGFYGRDFKINRAVLIPRWETELLVTRTLQKLAPLAGPVTLADIGTGSACIAVTLASERAGARVYATDISPLALRLARKNVARYGLDDRLTLLEGDLLAPLPQHVTFDAIVSNPPYIAPSDIPGLQPEVRDYEPELALAGDRGAAGEKGTDLYPRIFRGAFERLNPGGWVLVEVGQGQSAEVIAMAQAAGYKDVAAIDDFADIPRVVEGRKPQCG